MSPAERRAGARYCLDLANASDQQAAMHESAIPKGPAEKEERSRRAAQCHEKAAFYRQRAARILEGA